MLLLFCPLGGMNAIQFYDCDCSWKKKNAYMNTEKLALKFLYSKNPWGVVNNTKGELCCPSEEPE